MSGALALARQLVRVLRQRLAQVKRGGDDPVLLGRVGDRIALARRGSLGAPDVAELKRLGQHLEQAWRHERAGAHVAWLLLDPDDLPELRVARDELHQLALRERVQELDAPNRDPGMLWPGRVTDQVVVDLSRAQDQAGDLLGAGALG